VLLVLLSMLSLPVATKEALVLSLQINATVPITLVPAQLVLGGLQPSGYVYVGTNQGLAIWVSLEIVASSIMDDGE
jgi:hypothetical protein